MILCCAGKQHFNEYFGNKITKLQLSKSEITMWFKSDICNQNNTYMQSLGLKLSGLPKQHVIDIVEEIGLCDKILVVLHLKLVSLYEFVLSYLHTRCKRVTVDIEYKN